MASSPIDLVRQDQIAEYRPVLGAERTVLRVIDHGSDDVGGQHVGRKLQTLEAQRDALSQRLQRQGLGQARDTFQQDVAVGQQRDEQSVEKMPLTDDDAPHLFPQRADPARGFVDDFT
jgi:hypothetical protein